MKKKMKKYLAILLCVCFMISWAVGTGSVIVEAKEEEKEVPLYVKEGVELLIEKMKAEGKKYLPENEEDDRIYWERPDDLYFYYGDGQRPDDYFYVAQIIYSEKDGTFEFLNQYHRLEYLNYEDSILSEASFIYDTKTCSIERGANGETFSVNYFDENGWYGKITTSDFSLEYDETTECGVLEFISENDALKEEDAEELINRQITYGFARWEDFFRHDDPVDFGDIGFQAFRAQQFPSIFGGAHVQIDGWLESTASGRVIGTTGESKRLEALRLGCSIGGRNIGIRFTTYCKGLGWLPWSGNYGLSGTVGESRPMEAIRIEYNDLDPSAAEEFDIYYRVHVQNYGWLGWAKNGEIAGTLGLSKRMEAIQIIATRKNENAPEANFRGIVSDRSEALIQADSFTDNSKDYGGQEVKIAIRAHYQTYGWQEWDFNGEALGVNGESKRLEAFELMGYDGLNQRDLIYGVCTEGIQFDYYYNNSEYNDRKHIAGSVGESKPIYAITMGFNRDFPEKYDLYYRVYTGKYGWQGWVTDGEPAGVLSWHENAYDTRIERIQIAVVEKGGPAPGLEYNGVVGEAGKPGCYEYN